MKENENVMYAENERHSFLCGFIALRGDQLIRGFPGVWQHEWLQSISFWRFIFRINYVLYVLITAHQTHSSWSLAFGRPSMI